MLVLPGTALQPGILAETGKLRRPAPSLRQEVGGKNPGRSKGVNGTALITRDPPGHTAPIKLQIGDREVLVQVDRVTSRNLAKPGWMSWPTTAVPQVKLVIAVDEKSFVTYQMGTLRATAQVYRTQMRLY